MVYSGLTVDGRRIYSTCSKDITKAQRKRLVDVRKFVDVLLKGKAKANEAWRRAVKHVCGVTVKTKINAR